MVDEPDESDLQSEKKPTNPTRLGYKSQQALKVLCDEIEEVVKTYEIKFRKERCVHMSEVCVIRQMNLCIFILSILNDTVCYG